MTKDSAHKSDIFLDHFLSFAFKRSINPHILTLLTLGFGMITGLVLAAGYIRLAGILILLSGLCDLLDGYIARKFKRETKFGAFLDSVVDRYSELFIFGGLLLYFFFRIDTLNVILVCAAMTGAFITSYSRARAEALGVTCKLGIIKRPERIILLSLGAILNKIPVFLWIIAIFSNITVLQRVHWVYSKFKVKENKE
ncbi:MAG: CDP-alcohol phosphatidyltransferase family protein [Candidatus Omnitrophota bacterium]